MMGKEKTEQVSFKDTLNLPKTDFPMQAQAKIEDPIMIKRWENENLFANACAINEDAPQFILHDGPPYANGHIHLGHAYNKILKDIVTKSQRMMGKHVHVKPGWDCHGLPIEFKVSQENPNLPPQELKKACRAYANHWISIQKEEFKALGVLMDWNNPYLTMSYDYEAAILRAFGNFVADGYIERKNKTVPWCASCQTVLAAAEIEYQDRKDPSIYVLFPLVSQVVERILPQLKGHEVNLLIWTTTPWTLPLNRAVLIKPDAVYMVLDVNGTFVVVAKELADKLCALIGAEKKIVAEFNANELYAIAGKAHHPFIDNLTVPIISDDSVSLQDGTALVHCAPGCGPEDYEVGVKNSLEIFSPLSMDGKYTHGIQPEELEHMPVADGQIWVIKKLASLNRLLFKNTITHSYPHCWRCHKGLIFRATKQWFCDLSKGSLKQKALDAVDTIAMLPEKSSNSLKAALGGRLEWCLSRQRIWGVPIPAFVCTKCDYTYITQGLVEKVAQNVEKEGIEYWDMASAQELMPQGFSCPLCKGEEFKKEQDILDVWFDSGVSHYAVLKGKIGYPADMYLEGKDQHRGWYQSSLLTAMVLEGTPPMKSIVSHGFTVDEKGRKMSKSLGNVVAPQDIIAQLGTDGLRLWAATINYADDAVVSPVLLQNVKEVYRKIRNTCKFLLSNLYDFDKEKDAIPFEQMRIIDQQALYTLMEIQEALLKNYEDIDCTGVFHRLADYCAVDLSSLYLDIIKDRLYVEQADGVARRSAQTACWYIVDALTRLMAPILSITAEQVSDHYQKNKKQSIHLQQFAQLPFQKSPVVQQWELLAKIRPVVLKAIERLREQSVVKHSLESCVTLYMDDSLRAQLEPLFKKLGSQSIEDFFKEYFIVSSVIVVSKQENLLATELNGFFVRVERAQGVKCPRCWHYDETNHEHGLCRRCQRVLGR